MTTELLNKDVVTNHKGIFKFVNIMGTVDGRPVRATSDNETISDADAKTLLESKVGGA